MENKNFKKLFDEVAKNNGFKFSCGGWFKESDECIVILYLQKSNFGNYYELTIKTFVQGLFGRFYKKDKELKFATSDVFSSQPQECNDVLDLENLMEVETRKERLEKLFNDFIVPDANQTLSRAGIIELARNGVFILPAVKKELGIDN